MIGIEVQPRTPWITSVPSMSGSPRSRMITSGRSRATAASPLEPSMAVLTSYSRADRLIRSARKMEGSSSTTSTRVMPRRRARGSWLRAERGLVRYGGRERDRDREAAAGGVAGLDAPAQGVGEALGHGQAEADAGVPVGDPGERLENPFLLRVWNARPVVHDLKPHHAGIELRLQLGRLRGRGVPQRVGEQVGQHPLEQAGVGEHQRETL